MYRKFSYHLVKASHRDGSNMQADVQALTTTTAFLIVQ